MIVAVCGLKGGIGKSLVALHLAGEGVERGLATLLCDADVQRSALTWADVAAEKKHPSPTAIGVSSSLHKQLPPLAKAHALTVVDCPPRGDGMTRAALLVADLVLLPTGPAPTDFWALSGTVSLVHEAQALRPDLRAFLLLNRLQPRQTLSQTARSALAGLGLPVLQTALGNRTAFAESLARGRTVATHAPTSDAAAELRRLFEEVLEVASWPS